MFRNKNKADSEELIPVPTELPPLEGLEEQDQEELDSRPRIWLWTLVTALVVVVMIGYVFVLGVKGFYDGLKDRAVENQQFAQEHYTLGLDQLSAGNFELAIAEFELALRHDSNLPDARAQLYEAKEMAKAEIAPTSETRQDAAALLYRQAVAHYESGNLVQAVAVLDELRGLDADHQRDNVETMLATAHYQLGLGAVQEDRLQEAKEHFETVLALRPENVDAQDQLNLIQLYTAALKYWDQDWKATIQSLKGLYALAPEYKDVRTRLHDAYIRHAQTYEGDGDWCRAAEEYVAALQVAPLETTVDKQTAAAAKCQEIALAPTPSPTTETTTDKATAIATPPPAPKATTAPETATEEATGVADGVETEEPPTEASPTAAAASVPVGEGRIAFTSYDAVRQRNDIYVVNLAQGAAKLLRENASQPAMAPGGQRLTFRNLDSLHLGLGVLDLRTNELHELTTHTEDSTPTWSPNTAQIAFASNKHGDRKWRIYAISPQEVRGEGEEWVYGQMPAWSPDNSKLAYHGCDERGDNCGVWIMKAGGFDPARLTTDPGDTAPAWSPDGSQVAFISARAGNWEIFVVNVKDGHTTRLTEHAAADVAPTWSPDGKRLAFLSSREGAWAVYVLELESGKVQKVIATGDAYPDPVSERLSWTP